MRHSNLSDSGLFCRARSMSQDVLEVMWNQGLLLTCPWVLTQGWSTLPSLSTQDDSGRLLVYHDSLISTWYIVYCSKLHSTSYTCHVNRYMRIWVNLLLCKSDVCFLHCVNNKPCIMSLQQIRTAIMRRLGLGFFRRPFCCFVTMTSIPFIHLLRVWWSFISSSRTHWC